MRFADDRHVLDIAVATDRVFHLAREHVETGDDHDVLGPVDQREPAVGPGHRDVARVQPAVDEYRVRGFGIVPVPGEHVRAPHDDLARIVGERRVAVVVEQPHLDARQRRTDGARAALRVDRGGGHDG